MNVAYTAIMLAALLAGALVARRMQSPLGLSRAERLGVALGAFCGGMIGAKLPFVLSDWNGLVTGSAWWSDGKTILFGLVGGYFGVELAKWTLDIRVKTGDTFAVPVAVAVGIGRFGCLAAGCCYGMPTGLPWGLDFGDGLRRHPTQLYEAGFHLIAAAALAGMLSRGYFRGQLIKLYFLSYFVYRFATEFIRPEPRLWLNLTGYQWAALALMPVFALLWIQDARLRCG